MSSDPNPDAPSSKGWEPPLPEELQKMLPQYEITGIAGRGGMGAVYKARQTKLNRNVASLAWNPNGTEVAIGWLRGSTVGGEDTAITVFDIAEGKYTARLTGHTGSVTTLSWSPDGTRLASGSSDRTVRIWDVDSRTELVALRGHQAVVRSVKWSHDGTRLASGSNDATLRIWDATKGYEAEVERLKEEATK